ncbi:putative ribonuclease H-like domain-containing protein [Tanacetum coccineum]
MSFDDLYNNFNIVKQEVKGTASSSLISQNMAFMSSPSSTNKVNTAYGVSTGNTQVSPASTQVSIASTQVSTANLSDDAVYVFLANQPNGSQLVYEDLKQIHEDDIEEMDLKWQLALLSMRTKGGPRNQDNINRNQDISRRTVNVEETSSKAMVAIDGAGFDWSYVAYDEVPTNMALIAFQTSEELYDKLRVASVDEQLVFTKIEWVIFCSNLLFLKKLISSYKDHKLVCDDKVELEKLKQEKESNQLKIENFDNASKSLDKLIGSQMPDKSRKGVGFVSYNTISPPPTGLFSPQVDLSKSGLEEFQQPEFEGYEPKTSKSVSEDIYNEVRESLDTPLVKKLVSDDKLEKKTIFPTVAKIEFGHPQKEDQGYVDSGCSRHMTGNMSYLSDFKEFDGGYVTFGGGAKGGKITGKGTLKTGKLDFEDVYFVKELQFNLFSVSQMCDKKNSVLFTDTGCFVLSPDFKLADESQVLLKVPRKNNMYSVDMKNIVPKESLTCLVAKATLDESMLWHRRLGHVNFKTINKLVKENLVRGLPTKRFENDQTCVACLKGKQHKASCKSKIQNSITQPLFMLHMDLFGPTFVSSLMNKKYCLVVTDDYNRFTWVFFLATKDETSGILKSFITKVENLVDKKVKIIRCDNGTEFKNRVMSEFCEKKGIKKEFSVARTPQQNGVAERRNRTLIEDARTMLADSKLPTTFWAEAVNTACYVQNRVLVVKPHNKTPYELFRGRTPALSFMRPFGCHVTILNTLDYLGKFDGKSDKGFFIGYLMNSKAFRVYNIRTRKVEENLHIRFLEDKPIIASDGPKWLFDIDVLTKSMNYVPVVVGSTQDYILMPLWKYGSLFDSSLKNASNDEPQPSSDAGKKDDEGVCKEGHSSKEKRSSQDYILMPLWEIWFTNLFLLQRLLSLMMNRQPSSDAGKKDDEGVCKEGGNDDQERPKNSTQGVNTARPSINAEPDMFSLGDNATLEATYADFFGDKTEVDMSNITTTYPVPSTPNTRIYKDHSLNHVIDDVCTDKENDKDYK